MSLCPMSPNVLPNVRVHVLAFSRRNSPVDIDMDMVDMGMGNMELSRDGH